MMPKGAIAPLRCVDCVVIEKETRRERGDRIWVKPRHKAIQRYNGLTLKEGIFWETFRQHRIEPVLGVLIQPIPDPI